MRLLILFLCIFFQTACSENIANSFNNKTAKPHAQLIIEPARVIPETEFDIVLSFGSDKQLPVEILTAFIEGESMYMGKIPIYFEKSKANQFLAKAMVGVCSSKEMIWKITVDYKLSGSDIINSESLKFSVVNFLK